MHMNVSAVHYKDGTLNAYCFFTWQNESQIQESNDHEYTSI